MAIRQGADWRPAFQGGVVGGIAGGTAVAVITFLSALVAHRDTWIGMKVAGAPYLGLHVIRPGFEPIPVLVGLLCHYGIAILWGVFFAVLVYGLSRAATLAWGLFFGMAVWLVMFYAVLPAVGLSKLALGVPVARAIAEHLVFGLTVGLGVLPYQREYRRLVHHSV